MKKVVLGVVGGVLALVLLVYVLLTRDYESPELGRHLRDAVAASTGLELNAAAFRLNPSRGLWLEDVQLDGELASGPFSATLDELVFEHQLLPLLSGEVVVERIVFASPVITITAAEIPAEPATGATDETEAPAEAPPESPPPAAPAPAAEDTGLTLNVDEIAITNGRVVARSAEGEETFVVGGFDLTIRELAVDPTAGTGLAQLSGQGEFDAEELRMGGPSMAVSAGSFSADAGRLRLADFVISAPAGDLGVSELTADTSGEVLEYALSATASDVNPNVLMGIPEQSALGAATLTLDADGVGVGLDGLTASGALQLAAGSIPNIGPLATVDSTLGTTVVGSAYQATEIRFGLAGPDVTLEPFVLESDILRLAGEATADLGGPLSGRAGLGLPRSELGDDPGVAQNVLDAITNDDDWITIPVAIGGTLEAPTFGPDGDAIREALANAGRQAAQQVAQRGRQRLEEEARSGIRRLLGGDD